MGRLIRKKTASKKKIKKKNDENGIAVALGNGATENKPLSFVGFSKDTSKKKSLMTGKKLFSSSKPKQVKGKLEDSYIQQGLQFLREVKVELKKVTWPPRNQTVGSTIVVIVLVMIISLFLGMVDIGLSNLIRLVLH